MCLCKSSQIVANNTISRERSYTLLMMSCTRTEHVRHRVPALSALSSSVQVMGTDPCMSVSVKIMGGAPKLKNSTPPQKGKKISKRKPCSKLHVLHC